MARITVGMPAYNAEIHIAEAIESILNQSFDDLELMISDNASTDGTEAICRRYARMDKRVNFVRHVENLGATKNYNYVCREANSEFFKWHSSNDYCTRETIERCVNVLEAHPDVVLCYPLTKLFQVSLEDATDYDDSIVADDDSPILRFFRVIDNMKLNNVMNGIVRTEELRKTPLIKRFFYADRNMIAELALSGKIIPEAGCHFYRRMDADSATHLKDESEVLAHFDPRWKRPLPFTHWRILSAYFSSLARSNISLWAKASALPLLGRRAWWEKEGLWTDTTAAIRYARIDLVTMISGAHR